MDPTANLIELRQLIKEIRNSPDDMDADDVERMMDLFESLDEWLTRGGFMPHHWQSCHEVVGVPTYQGRAPDHNEEGYGYILADNGQYYVQIPADNYYDFVITDGETIYDPMDGPETFPFTGWAWRTKSDVPKTEQDRLGHIYDAIDWDAIAPQS